MRLDVAEPGYAVSSVLFIGLFVVAVAAQIAVRSFHPFSIG